MIKGNAAFFRNKVRITCIPDVEGIVYSINPDDDAALFG